MKYFLTSTDADVVTALLKLQTCSITVENSAFDLSDIAPLFRNVVVYQDGTATDVIMSFEADFLVQNSTTAGVTLTQKDSSGEVIFTNFSNTTFTKFIGGKGYLLSVESLQTVMPVIGPLQITANGTAAGLGTNCFISNTALWFCDTDASPIGAVSAKGVQFNTDLAALARTASSRLQTKQSELNSLFFNLQK